MMNKTDSERLQRNNRLPQTYLGLIEKVGGKGKYQYILALIFTLSYYVTGIVLMSTAFIFNNPQFDCEALGLITDSCYDTVCSLPREQWPKFITSDAQKFRSLANQFGTYYCDDQVILNAYSSAPYFGSFIGCFFISILADNIGRRVSILISGWITVLGVVLLCSAQQLWMASLGLVFCGMGSDSVLAIYGASVAQLMDDIFRQKVTSIVQAAFTFGALLITLIYYLFQDWFIASLYFLAIPAVINALLLTYYLKQSPMYLILKDPKKALDQINQIGLINSGKSNILTMEDIQSVMKCQQTIKYDKPSTPLDVFRYASLRTITIAQGFISMATFLMYYGPTLIITQFGFDIYTSETVLNVADIVTYYPLMLIVDKTKRRKLASLLFLTATIASIFLIFITKPTSCDLCATIFVQLALVFIFRSAISMEFALLAIYSTELYPIRVRNISGSVLSVFGTTSSTLSPIIMGAFTRAGWNHFILFTILGIIAIGSYMACPETLGKLCPEQIEQIEYEKHKNSVLVKSQLQDQKLHKI